MYSDFAHEYIHKRTEEYDKNMGINMNSERSFNKGNVVNAMSLIWFCYSLHRSL